MQSLPAPGTMRAGIGVAGNRLRMQRVTKPIPPARRDQDPLRKSPPAEPLGSAATRREHGRWSASAVGSLLRETYAEWSEDEAVRLAAALAYYTIFSIAPLLVVAIGLAGLVFGREAVQGHIVGQIAGLVGADGARAIEELIENASKPSAGALAAVVGFLALLFGASGVVGELKAALNRIWDVPTGSAGFWSVIRQRLASFAAVLGIGFVLLVSLAISAALTAAGAYFENVLPGADSVWLVVNYAVALAVETALFALMFKLLPDDVKIAWSDVWIGAAITALLFESGKMLVGLYLGSAGIGSAYGAAGSLIVVLVWVYYSAQILFFGAEFTQVYARRYGSAPAPQRRD
jgi:membrane protein